MKKEEKKAAPCQKEQDKSLPCQKESEKSWVDVAKAQASKPLAWKKKEEKNEGKDGEEKKGEVKREEKKAAPCQKEPAQKEGGGSCILPKEAAFGAQPTAEAGRPEEGPEDLFVTILFHTKPRAQKGKAALPKGSWTAALPKGC